MLSGEVVFPSSSNWYLAHSVDTLANGTLVIATNQSVAVVDGATRRIVGICSLRSRVTGVALCESYICACTSDKVVAAFDIAKGDSAATSAFIPASSSPVGSHKDHHGEPSAIAVVTNIQVAESSENTSSHNIIDNPICITGDKRGTLCLWHLPQAGARGVGNGGGMNSRGLERLCPQREAIVCFAAPTSSTISARLAVGYASGAAVVIDLKSQAALFTLQHRGQVQSLSWVLPATGASNSCSLLASACQDQSVQLWKLDKAGVAEVSEQVFEPLASSTGTQPEGRHWASVYAVSESIILYSGPRGELYSWEIDRRKPQRAASVHTRPIFSIRPVGEEHVVTVGMDRVVAMWNLGKGSPQLKWRLCGLGGHVTALRTDGANVAVVGCGDGQARVVDLMHREHRQHCWVVWRGLRSPMTCVMPGRVAGVWAYGLQDGSFGLLPISAADGPGNAERASTHSHPGPVTSLCWLLAPSLEPVVSESQGGDDAPVPEALATKGGRAPKSKSKKADGSAKKATNGSGVQTNAQLAAIPHNAVLVTVSAGHQIVSTPVGRWLRSGGNVASSPLRLSSLAIPAAAGAWPLPAEEGGDALIVAAAQRARDDGLETNSLQVLQFEPGDKSTLVTTLVASMEGFDGGTSAMSVWPLHVDGAHACRIVCATSKGHLSVFTLRCPLPKSSTASKTADIIVRHAHSKSIADVQWRLPAQQVSGSELLTAGLDGVIKVWRYDVLPLQLTCLHAVGGPIPSVAGGPVLAACWDVSSGKLAVLGGGRDQVAFRWVAGEGKEITTELGTSYSKEGNEMHCGRSHAMSTTDLPQKPIASTSVSAMAAAPVSAPCRGGGLGGGTQKAKIKQSSSMLSLASAALYQQSAKARALDVAKLAPSGLDLWPGEDLLVPPDGATPQSLVSAIFVNQQEYADWWVHTELKHKVQTVSEENALSAQRARMLKLWATDVQEALDLNVCDESCENSALPVAWVWAALSPAGADGAWDAAMARLFSDAPKSGHSCPDAVHFLAAAALALGRDDDAVRAYMRSELLHDALLLARLRFPARHPLVTYVYEQWAADLRRRNRLDQAAACQLAVGHWGLALTDLEDWLSTARSSRLGADPVRLALSFTAASIAECIASRHIRTLTKSPLWLEDDSCETKEYDMAIAFDHRHWWGQPELRIAVQAWKRCMSEAMQASRLRQALAYAQFDCQRELTGGEQFLRAALSGYASAVGWWFHLSLCGEPQGRYATQDDTATPLHVFLNQNQEAVVPDEDWDFEWRALTWLPTFDPRADPLMTAAVELGRACACLASGSTRASSAGDAPWDHVANAVNALVGAGDSVTQPAFAEMLQRLGELALRPNGPSAAERAWGECVRMCSSMAATKEDIAGMDSWEILSKCLFGLPVAHDARSSCLVAATALRRGYDLVLRSNPSFSLSACVAATADAMSAYRELSELQVSCLCNELESAVMHATEACGLLRPEAASLPPDCESDGLSERTVARIRHIHVSCTCSVLVPMAIASWCVRLRTRPIMDEGDHDEYETVAGDQLSVQSPPLLAKALRAIGCLIDELLSSVEANATSDAGQIDGAEEALALRGVCKLDALEHLMWPARLSLLRRRFGESRTSASIEDPWSGIVGEASLGPVHAVCSLLITALAESPSPYTNENIGHGGEKR